MSKKYDAILFIGRFHPLHNAHVEMLQRAADLSNKLIVIMGSANQPRTFKNPWSDTERQSVLEQALTQIKTVKNDPDFSFVVDKNPDTIHDNPAWASRVEKIVAKYTTDDDRIAIIGHKKDETSFYIDMFPQWDIIDQELIEQLNASDIRDLYFKNDANLKYLKHVVPDITYQFLTKFKEQPEYQLIIQERDYVRKFRQPYESLPYGVIFVTTDAVVVQNNHVLLIRRRNFPGQGLYALPGGFVDPSGDNSVQDAMLRELIEETNIDLPRDYLTTHITKTKVFDAKGRSSRGRTITHAFYIELPDTGVFPTIVAGDDAASAEFVEFSQIDTSQVYEDHWEIINYFIGK